ncbi:SUMF1/EgtB/PvdO family nonheme iron enzyme [Bosea sp. RAF48]|uniref:SUMF1/EgtB/PvdO family nonheme iron enzyme n=1 Tax=Bosea sp. RAF48 TaxID=3237480 RepID=UPI003F90F1F3
MKPTAPRFHRGAVGLTTLCASNEDAVRDAGVPDRLLASLPGDQVDIGAAPPPDIVFIPGGTFRMGSDRHYPEEAPARRVTVDGFWMDRIFPDAQPAVQRVRQGYRLRHLRWGRPRSEGLFRDASADDRRWIARVHGSEGPGPIRAIWAIVKPAEGRELASSLRP